MNGWHQMNPKHKSRDTKIDKRRNMKEQNAFYKEKHKGKKEKKRYGKADM